MGPILILAFGVGAYAVFLGTFLYAIAFVGDFGVPKTVDAGSTAPFGQAIVVDILLLSVFALQHSVMARKPFKRWWTQIVPAAIAVRPSRGSGHPCSTSSCATRSISVSSLRSGRRP
jgi:protein-S-isoprenylcysteine O-methyltransferase Ste14